jgi:hypothetical protein
MWRVPAKPAAHVSQLLASPVVLWHSQPPSASQWSGATQFVAQSAPHFWPEHGVMHCPPADASVWKPALQPAHFTFPPAVLSHVTPSWLQLRAASVVEQAWPHSVPNLFAGHFAQLSLSSLSLKPLWHVPHLALPPSFESQVMPSACRGTGHTGKVHEEALDRRHVRVY